MRSLGAVVTSVSHDLPSMQNDPVVSKASELLRLGLMPSAESIKAGQVRSSVVMLYLGAQMLQPAEHTRYRHIICCGECLP
jgi:hypothetical protein